MRIPILFMTALLSVPAVFSHPGADIATKIDNAEINTAASQDWKTVIHKAFSAFKAKNLRRVFRSGEAGVESGASLAVSPV